MKILLPVIQHKNQNITLDDDVVIGGVELFQKLVYKNIQNVIPVYISFEDRIQRRSSSLMEKAIAEHSPDLIFTNHFSRTYTVGFQKFNIPVVWLNHSPGIRSLYNVESVKAMHEFSARNGSIYFVSRDQHMKFDAISKRIVGKEIPNTHGYINSAFSDGTESVSELKEYDAITVGRTDLTKNPFFLHKKLEKSKLTSCVVTNTPLFDSENQNEYAEKNAHWKEPRTVFRNLSHDDAMKILEKGHVYVSTCPLESWGITSLEALTRGLPVVLVTDSSGTHGSQTVAESDTDYRLVGSSIKPDELERVILEFKNLTHEQRLDISNRTKKKHTPENWRKSVIDMFESSIDHYNTTESEGLFVFR